MRRVARAWPRVACAVLLFGSALPCTDGSARAAVPEGVLPQCANTLDDDGDGLADFPADPGCASDASDAEAPEPVCSDGVDNDVDGNVDYPADRDCFAATDPSEAPACADGLDNDGDGLADLDDPDCLGSTDPTESEAPHCSNLVDDDADGLRDFPDDPGCMSAADVDEQDVPFAGDAVRPRFLIAVATADGFNGDTCGNAFTGGDGSLECPGSDVECSACPASTCDNQLADDALLWHLRHALHDVMARAGGFEVGLLRSRQRAGEFTCHAGTSASPSGGWQGAGPGCYGGFDAGELLVRIEDDTWSGFAPLLDAEGGSAFLEPGRDTELRGSGLRPVGSMLTTARAYLQERRADDPAASCRPYRVVLLADGGEQCGADAPAAAGQLFDDGFPVHVVGLGGALPSELNPIAAQGGTGLPVFVNEAAELSASLQSLFEQSRLQESCNGMDDDCDGLVDEDYPLLGDACDNGQLGACLTQGTWQCDGGGAAMCTAPTATPGAEVCNGEDDDCDGRVDEDGVCATEELCNGADDDQDQLIDEGFPLGQACVSGLGACAAPGVLACSADQLSVECRPTGTPLAPARHDLLCDGIDEDCDGEVDEEATGAMVAVTGLPDTLYIDRYEASRPGAGPATEGWRTARACSQPAVLPWRNVTQGEAAQACAAAGKRLCSVAELATSCAGPSGFAYPYGSAYVPDACNGEDHAPDCAVPDRDEALPTGSIRGCPAGAASTCRGASGIEDLSGNLREWTGTPEGPQAHHAHGGGYLDQAPALACATTIAIDPLLRQPDLGFRCCADALPDVPPVLEVAVTGSDFGRVRSTPAGIECPYDCQQDYPPGTVVTLEAIALPGARFAGWSGQCEGLEDCTVSMQVDAEVTALFEPLPVGDAVFSDGFEDSNASR